MGFRGRGMAILRDSETCDGFKNRSFGGRAQHRAGESKKPLSS